MLTKRNNQAFFFFNRSLSRFFFLFLPVFFLFNIFLIHLLFRKKFTDRIVGKKMWAVRRKQAFSFFFGLFASFFFLLLMKK